MASFFYCLPQFAQFLTVGKRIGEMFENAVDQQVEEVDLLLFLDVVDVEQMFVGEKTFEPVSIAQGHIRVGGGGGEGEFLVAVAPVAVGVEGD